MRLIYHGKAFEDIRDAVEFYESQAPEAAEALKTEIKRSLRLIETDPERFPIVEDDVRRCRVQNFPFDLYFSTDGKCVMFHALVHHSRAPDRWKDRLDQ
jgi:plasmid stabilization system protein ParE